MWCRYRGEKSARAEQRYTRWYITREQRGSEKEEDARVDPLALHTVQVQIPAFLDAEMLWCAARSDGVSVDQANTPNPPLLSHGFQPVIAFERDGLRSAAQLTAWRLVMEPAHH